MLTTTRPSTRGPSVPRIALDVSAPDFTLADFTGTPVSLADYTGSRHVLLVFNRGFT